MLSLVCEHCRGPFQRPRVRRFCSQKCRYHGLASQGFRPVHAAPHSDAARAKIKAKRAQQGPVWNAGKVTGLAPWNKGLTAATNETVAGYARKVAEATRGKQRQPLTTVTKAKLSAGRKGEANWAKRPEVREKIRQAVLRLYKERPEILENRKRAGRNQFPGNFSSLELLIAAALDTAGLPYLHNSKVGRYWPDFIVLDRVVIECDGDYWHRDAERDRRRDAYLTDRGLFVFHLREADILADAVECVRRVTRVYEPFTELAV